MENLTSRAKRSTTNEGNDNDTAERPSKEQKIAYNTSNKQTSDKPSLLGTIITLWQTIEPFLTLEDTISSSKTCKTLHDTIIDADTRKVKVSHFEFISKRETVVHFLPWALNSIHFPSLRNIQYPPTISQGTELVNQVTDDEITEIIDVCFPTFCTYLSQAYNLERLAIDANKMMQCLYDSYESTRNIIIGIFGQNLSYCKKLKELTVVNVGEIANDQDDEEPGFFYSVELLKALTPVISKRKDNLEVLNVVINGISAERDEDLAIPVDSQVAQDIASQDFFDAILSTTNILDLTLDIALMKVAEKRMRNGTVYQSDQLQKLKLCLEYEDERIDYDPDEVTIVPLMLSFSKCSSLQVIELDLPVRFWLEKDSLSTFAKLLKNKLHLKTLICDFNKFNDQDEKVLMLLTDFAKACKNNKYPQLKTIELKRIKLSHNVFLKFTEVLVSIPGSTRRHISASGGSYTFKRWLDYPPEIFGLRR